MDMVQWRARAAPVNPIERRLHQLFDQPFRFPFLTEDMGWSPSVEVTETNGSIDVTAELPGVAKDDIEVNLENNVLTIRGEKKEERKEEQKDVFLLERYYGSFQRTLALPAPVNEAEVTASFRDGVLTIHLEKAARAKGKKVEIDA